MFTVFHDHNEAEPKQENLSTLQTFTQKHWDNVKMHIHIEGHTDRSGSKFYNKTLSLARASAVADAIATPWPYEYTLSISGAGEDKPAFQTNDDVREPRNRRSQIKISFMLKK